MMLRLIALVVSLNGSLAIVVILLMSIFDNNNNAKSFAEHTEG